MCVYMCGGFHKWGIPKWMVYKGEGQARRSWHLQLLPEFLLMHGLEKTAGHGHHGQTGYPMPNV